VFKRKQKKVEGGQTVNLSLAEMSAIGDKLVETIVMSARNKATDYFIINQKTAEHTKLYENTHVASHLKQLDAKTLWYFTIANDALIEAIPSACKVVGITDVQVIRTIINPVTFTMLGNMLMAVENEMDGMSQLQQHMEKNK